MMLLFTVGGSDYQVESDCGFQKANQQLRFPAHLEENIGRNFRSSLAIPTGEIHELQSDLHPIEQA
jgi:hypothetical protein